MEQQETKEILRSALRLTREEGKGLSLNDVAMVIEEVYDQTEIDALLMSLKPL